MALDLTCRIARNAKRLVLMAALGAIWHCPSALAQTQAQQPQPKPATTHTIDFNKTSTAGYPWSDTTDFRNAKRGFIAPLPNNGVIKGKDGKVVNDLSKFEFIKQDQPAPDTVNPSLWRVSQLLNISGLFEVVPGVYQVRGADLANMTIVEGDTGITIYDPLTSAEAARYALDLYYQHRPRKPVVAVVHSHSHVDHVAGVRGVVDEADVKAGKVKIYAPEGFHRRLRGRERVRRHRHEPALQLSVRVHGAARSKGLSHIGPRLPDLGRHGDDDPANRLHQQDR